MTWFKVDDGFYDHPKLVGVPMASRGLWVTAGSYCSRHLTDGVISWRQIRALGGTKAQVRGLLDAGLWRAIGERSGSESFAFHDWIESQPTKSSVLDARERERNKKAKWREAKGKKAADQQEPGNVHGGQVGPGDRGQNRPSTVSRPDPTRPDPYIGASAQLSPSARDDLPPSDRCPAHIGVDHPLACGGCAQARRDLETWQAEKRRADIEAEREHRAAQADAERAAIDDCTLCDTRGYRNRRVCNHDPTEDDRRRRGLAEARSILAEKGIA